MLFSIRNDDFESEKERNLYYKFFAGYFLNEHVQGLEMRLQAFCDLLSNCSRGGKNISQEPITLTPECAHVSFDNHGYLFSGLGTDRGEFADILVHDRSTSVVIPIEAKVHSNWSYEKDVISNERRLRLIEREMPSARFFFCFHYQSIMVLSERHYLFTDIFDRFGMRHFLCVCLKPVYLGGANDG